MFFWDRQSSHFFTEEDTRQHEFYETDSSQYIFKETDNLEKWWENITAKPTFTNQSEVMGFIKKVTHLRPLVVLD